jgi:hypothetical protein
MRHNGVIFGSEYASTWSWNSLNANVHSTFTGFGSWTLHTVCLHLSLYEHRLSYKFLLTLLLATYVELYMFILTFVEILRYFFFLVVVVSFCFSLLWWLGFFRAFHLLRCFTLFFVYVNLLLFCFIFLFYIFRSPFLWVV